MSLATAKKADQPTHTIDTIIDKLDVDHHYPLMLILDMTNLCNFKCPHCPQPVLAKTEGFKPSFFSYETFTQIIDEIHDKGVKFLRFSGEGEPMLNKRLIDMVAYAKQKTDTALVLTTNGSLLDEKRTLQLLELGIDVIDISLDAFTKSSYAIVRRGGNYHQVMENIHRLLAIREKKKFKTKVMVNMIDQQHVEDEVEDFKKFWEPLVDFVLVRRLHTATKQVNLTEVSEKMAKTQPHRHACAHLWKRLTIDPKNNIKFCAHDWNTETVLSKFGSEGITGVWFDKRIQEIRQAHRDNNYQNASACANCPDWNAAPWDYGFEKILQKIGVIDLPF